MLTEEELTSLRARVERAGRQTHWLRVSMSIVIPIVVVLTVAIVNVLRPLPPGATDDHVAFWVWLTEFVIRFGLVFAALCPALGLGIGVSLVAGNIRRQRHQRALSDLFEHLPLVARERLLTPICEGGVGDTRTLAKELLRMRFPGDADVTAAGAPPGDGAEVSPPTGID